ISTDGAAPALAGLLREALEGALPDDLERWIAEARAQRLKWKEAAVPIAERRPLLLEALNRIYGTAAPQSGPPAALQAQESAAPQAQESAAPQAQESAAPQAQESAAPQAQQPSRGGAAATPPQPPSPRNRGSPPPETSP